MRKYLLLPLVLLAALGLLASACSDDDESSDSAALSSEDQDGSEDSGSDSDSDLSIPDLDELDDKIPGLGSLDDCFELATEYGSLYVQALAGEDGARAAQQEAEELKDVLPSDLHDDIDVVAEAIGEIASEGLLGGSEALDTPAYNEANDAITEYFEQECGG